MPLPIPRRSFHLFRPPYRDLEPTVDPGALPPSLGVKGVALVWCMLADRCESEIQSVRTRPGGVSLLVVLPPADTVVRKDEIFRMIEFCRPTAVLPHHEEPHPDDLRTLLGAIPDDFPAAVVDYLRWRGISLDTDIRRMVRRTLELSAEIRSVNALSRGIYLSRRALGRRFTGAGLPVPSHWLHMARVLRAALRVQEGGTPLARIAYELGYPDGFALSNQMKRLTDVRPSEVRDRLGWEWLLESWVRKEVAEGGFSPAMARRMGFAGEPAAPGATRGISVPHPESTSRAAAPREQDASRRP